MILPPSETINTTPAFVGENRKGWRLRDGRSVENNKWGFLTKAVKSRRGWESRQKNRLFQVGFSLETGFRDMRWQSREPLAQLSTAKHSLVGTPFTVLHWNPTLHSTLRIKFSKATLILCYNMSTRRCCYNLWLRTHSRKWKHRLHLLLLLLFCVLNHLQVGVHLRGSGQGWSEWIQSTEENWPPCHWFGAPTPQQPHKQLLFQSAQSAPIFAANKMHPDNSVWLKKVTAPLFFWLEAPCSM